jgi:hypothetical protein
MQSRLLEVAIGLSLSYLFLSVLVLHCVEAVNTFFAQRARFLRDALERLLDEESAKTLLAHPEISALAMQEVGGVKLPSWIPPATFARVVVDRAAVLKLPAEIRQLCELAAVGGERELARIAGWFATAMDRVTGAYKRHSYVWSLGLAIVFVVASNTDAVGMGRELWKDAAVRASSGAVAGKVLQSCGDDAKACGDAIRAHDSELPLFWSAAERAALAGGGLRHLAAKLFGLLVSTLAVSLGAPFWFDVLRKIAPGVRLSGPTDDAPAPQ